MEPGKRTDRVKTTDRNRDLVPDSWRLVKEPTEKERKNDGQKLTVTWFQTAAALCQQ